MSNDFRGKQRGYGLTNDEQISQFSANTLEGLCQLLSQYLCGRENTPQTFNFQSEKEVFRLLLDENGQLVIQVALMFEQFNALLLLFNQDIVSRGFFNFFLGPQINNIDELKTGISKFRLFAMLAFGNFRYAFKTLMAFSYNEICEKLQDYIECESKNHFPLENRPSPISSPEIIPKQETFYHCYLTGARIERDGIYLADIDPIQLNKLHKDNESDPAKAIFRERFKNLLNKYKITQKRIEEVEQIALKNSDIYLTSDYLDVYIATSMRKPWEFQETFQFSQDIFQHSTIRPLNLRVFDPTQSLELNRIDKGLAEALMLKRAKICIYMAQESDTFGKDSELASTLAQLKPVIAYIPRVDIIPYSDKIDKYPLDYFYERITTHLGLQLYKDDRIKPELNKAGFTYIDISRNFQTTIENNQHMVDVHDFFLSWLKRIEEYKIEPLSLFLAEEEERNFKDQEDHSEEWKQLCYLLAILDKHFYNKRANTLKNSHPLGIQVHLESGVANGVLIVRSALDCIKVLQKFFTKSLTFSIRHKDNITELVETITGCIFRVVTGNRRLSNSFWNYYLKK